jgi:hypothetical protein
MKYKASFLVIKHFHHVKSSKIIRFHIDIIIVTIISKPFKVKKLF